jgi:2'-5' RNA ligase
MRSSHELHQSELRDHWQWRPEWAPDRPCLYWYLAVRDDRLARTWESLLTPLHRVGWLDVVPPHWWHVTLCDVGFADELDRATVDAVVDAVTDAVRERAYPPGPLQLTCVPVELTATAVTARIDSGEVLHDLQATVRDHTQEVLGDDRPLVHRHAFRPHVSLGYANRSVSTTELREVVGALPDVPGEVHVDRLSLVAVTRRGGHYQWTVQHEVPLVPRGPAVSSRADPAAHEARRIPTPFAKMERL